MSRSFAVCIHKGTNILPPNSLSAHKRRNKGITMCSSYYVSVSERDNVLSLLCTVYLRERDNIMSPHFYCVSPRISQEGQYNVPLTHIFREMDNSIVPFIRLSFTERDIILSLSAYPFSVFSQRDRIKRGIIYCPSYTQTT